VDFTSLTDPVVTFDYAYATSNSLIDMLEIWYSTSYEHNYTLLTSMAGGAAGPLNTGGSTNLEFIPAAHQWATESYNLPSGTTRVLFRGISSNGNNLFLDNITFHGNCPAPEELAATNFTSSGAELGWTPVGVSGTWQIRWGVVGFDTLNEGALIPGVTSNLYFLEGLQPGQVYEFYVRSDCGGAYSSWAGPVSFSAVCESVNVPFYENFDLLTIPSTGCQEVINSNGDNITWITSSDFPASYSNSMFISKNSALEMNDWFFSPGVSLVEGITYSFNFVYRGNGAGSPGKLELLVGSGPTPSEMTGGLLWSDSDIQTSEYFPGTFNYIPVASGITFFGFHGYSTAGTGFLCVDDIAIDEAFIYWNGNNSSAWGDPANWFPQVIPNGFQNVIISSGTPNNPAIDYQGPECKNLTIEPGAMLSIIPGGEITVKGNITIREAAILNNEGLIILKGDLNNQNPE
ncbi:MAG: choice-of-anchor J domain-containing protein, partial [Bacteroidetes bacterium]|nr:choice-of-anchor J domain-containing protein [Bacteroidota bacterium]